MRRGLKAEVSLYKAAIENSRSRYSKDLQAELGAGLQHDNSRMARKLNIGLHGTVQRHRSKSCRNM